MTIIDKLNIPLYNNLWKPSKTDQFYFIDMVGKIQLFQKNDLFMDNKQEFKIELIENYNGIEIILNDKEEQNGV